LRTCHAAVHGQTVTWNLGGLRRCLASPSIIDELLRRATALAIGRLDDATSAPAVASRRPKPGGYVDPRHFREITLRGRQGPAFPRTGTSKGVLRLRGPPGDLGNHSNRRMQHPRGWYLFGEKLEPFQIINTDGRRRPVAPCSSCSVWRCAYHPSAFALFAQTSSASDLRSIGSTAKSAEDPYH